MLLLFNAFRCVIFNNYSRQCAFNGLKLTTKSRIVLFRNQKRIAIAGIVVLMYPNHFVAAARALLMR